MKGRSPYNKFRKKELHNYLMEKEKVRWKDILSDFRKLKWGPTTLKTTLDNMVKDGIIYREIKDSQEGPEVWYCLSLQKIQGKRIFEFQKTGVPMDIELFSLEELKGFESSDRKNVFPIMFQLYMAKFIDYFFLTALSKFRNPTLPKINESLQEASEYFYDVVFKNGFQKLRDFVLAFPKDAQSDIAEMLGTQELTARVEGREKEVITKIQERLNNVKEHWNSKKGTYIELFKDLEKKVHSKREKLEIQKLIEDISSERL